MKKSFADQCLERAAEIKFRSDWTTVSVVTLLADSEELARRLNKAIGTIATLLETAECREDEDCDHCVATQVIDELEALPVDSYGSQELEGDDFDLKDLEEE